MVHDLTIQTDSEVTPNWSSTNLKMPCNYMVLLIAAYKEIAPTSSRLTPNLLAYVFMVFSFITVRDIAVATIETELLFLTLSTCRL